MKALRAKSVLAAVLCALLLIAPAPAAARVTVTLQFAYGSVVAGGVGFFIYFAGEWETHLAARNLPTSLLEIRGERVRFGLPLPRLRPTPDAGGLRGPGDGVQLDLVRWRF